MTTEDVERALVHLRCVEQNYDPESVAKGRDMLRLARVARTLEAALAASEQRAVAMRAALVKIRDYEAGEDEQAREYGVLEPDKVGYCFGLANAALSATPPAAAPSVPDAAGAEEAKLLHGRILELLREIEWNGTSLRGGRPVAICPACFESREPNITGQGGHKVACPLALTIRQLIRALAPAAQQAPASAGPGDAKAGE